MSRSTAATAHRRVNVAAVVLLAVAAATVWVVVQSRAREAAATVRATAAARATDPPPHTPVRIDIPAAGVHAAVMDLGLTDDGSPQALTGTQRGYAGWYDHSSAPGDGGAAVIVGRDVFRRLGALRGHDSIDITRQDGSHARFTVTRVDDSPTAAALLDPGGGDRPSLRLISGAGVFVYAIPEA
ncbi:MAG: hypothetical protein QOF84_658 [Streptomyces sp.]|jgi:hypothetical protein|nr:hypothetical protein [Streptomyces sp.]